MLFWGGRYEIWNTVYPEIDNFVVLGGDNELQSVGRPNKRESESRKAGGEIRNQLTSEVRENKFIRPKANWFREHNRVYNLQ